MTSFQITADRLITDSINPKSSIVTLNGILAVNERLRVDEIVSYSGNTFPQFPNGLVVPAASSMYVRKIERTAPGIPIELVHDTTALTILTVNDRLDTDAIRSRSNNITLQTPNIGGEIVLTADRSLRTDKLITHSGTLGLTGNLTTTGNVTTPNLYTDVIYPSNSTINFQGPVVFPLGTHTVNGSLLVIGGVSTSLISSLGTTVTIDDNLTLTASKKLTSPCVETPVLQGTGSDAIVVNNVLQLQAVILDTTAEDILARNSANQLVRISKLSLSNVWAESFQYGSIVLSSLSSSAILRDIIFDRVWYFKRNNASVESDYVLVSNFDSEKTASSSITFRNTTTTTPQMEFGALISPVVSFSFEISFKLSHTTGFWIDGLHRFYIGLGRNLYITSACGDYGGVGLEYTRSTNGDRFRVITSTTPSVIASSADTGVAVNTSWNTLKIVMVKAASFTASVFLNGTSVATGIILPLFKFGPRVYHEYTNLSGVSPGTSFGLRLSECRITY